jgi:hypothetical protein
MLVPPINLVSRFLTLALTNSNTAIAKSIVQSRCCLLQAKLPMSVRCTTDPTHRSSQLPHPVGGGLGDGPYRTSGRLYCHQCNYLQDQEGLCRQRQGGNMKSGHRAGPIGHENALWPVICRPTIKELMESVPS